MKNSRISIIGGTDGLGKTIAKYLKEKGFEVIISGPDEIKGNVLTKELEVEYFKDNKKAVINADIVIVAVPIKLTIEVIEEVGPLMKKGSVLMDVTSIKSKISHFMNDINKNIEVIPTHPIFGPRINSIEDQTVVLTPIKKGKWYERIKSFLEDEGVLVIYSSPEEHDNMMSVVQVLTHFSYICTALTIKELSITVNDSRKFSSPNYGIMVDMVSRIIAQNPKLTYSIQKESERGDIVRNTFLDVVKSLKNIIEQDEEEKYINTIEKSTKKLGDIESALSRSDKVIDLISNEYKILKNKLNQEIGLRELYTNEVHFGILKKVYKDQIILEEKGLDSKTKQITKKINLSTVYLMEDIELENWKLKNIELSSTKIEINLPKESNLNDLINYMSKLKGINTVSILENKLLKIKSNEKNSDETLNVIFNVKHINKDLIELENLFKLFGFKIKYI